VKIADGNRGRRARELGADASIPLAQRKNVARRKTNALSAMRLCLAFKSFSTTAHWVRSQASNVSFSSTNDDDIRSSPGAQRRARIQDFATPRSLCDGGRLPLL